MRKKDARMLLSLIKFRAIELSILGDLAKHLGRDWTFGRLAFDSKRNNYN